MAMNSRISVVVVDDHSLFRTGVIQSLALDSQIEVVGQGASAFEAVQLVGALSPDIALIDISMPGNGIEAAAEIIAMARNTRVIMLTVSETDDDIMRSLEIGAVGYILKGIGASDLLLAVRSVAAGDTFVSPNLALRLLSNMNAKKRTGLLSTLSQQEERTLRLVSLGLSNRAVGERLGVLEKTVKFHMTHILHKLGVKNRVEATLIAQREWGLERGELD